MIEKAVVACHREGEAIGIDRDRRRKLFQAAGRHRHALGQGLPGPGRLEAVFIDMILIEDHPGRPVGLALLLPVEARDLGRDVG